MNKKFRNLKCNIVMRLLGERDSRSLDDSPFAADGVIPVDKDTFDFLCNLTLLTGDVSLHRTVLAERSFSDDDLSTEFFLWHRMDEANDLVDANISTDEFEDVFIGGVLHARYSPGEQHVPFQFQMQRTSAVGGPQADVDVYFAIPADKMQEILLEFKSECELKEFTLYWRDGKREVLKGTSIDDSMRARGYGQGAVAALDFYKEGNCEAYVRDNEKKEWVLKDPVAVKVDLG